MKTRKAQIKLMESVMVLLVFFVLLAIGIIFFAKLQNDASKAAAREANEEKALRVSKTAITLPELQCSRLQQIENCIDRLKIRAFSENLREEPAKQTYRQVFRNSDIKIQSIYPQQETITLYTAENPTKSKRSIWFPVAILDPIKGTTSYGTISVDTYE